MEDSMSRLKDVAWKTITHYRQDHTDDPTQTLVILAGYEEYLTLRRFITDSPAAYGRPERDGNGMRLFGLDVFEVSRPTYFAVAEILR